MHAPVLHQAVIRPVRRTPKRVRRARTLRVLAILLVALAVLVFGPRAVDTMAHTEAPPVATYTVASGDTLWGIATRYSTGEDIRKVVYAIKQANHLETPNVMPGQVLTIPLASAR